MVEPAGSAGLQPVRLDPIPVPRVWGGDRLLTEVHPGLNATPPIGETWEVSDVGEDPALHSRIRSGPHAGRTLRELVREDRDRWLGEAVPGHELPLLYKFIDAREVLSVQVHPADELVAELGLPGFGKSEAWVILDAPPGGEIIYGLDDSLTLSRYVENARTGAGAEGFCRVSVARGDVVNLPAGVLHAIGAGILLAEIQQSSDITYRIHDWGRLGLDGRPRDLHLDEAARVVAPATVPPCPLPVPDPDGTFQVRIEGPPFTLRELRSAGSATSVPHRPGERFGILSVLEGRTTISWSGGETGAGPGDVLFVPAGSPEIRIAAPDPAWVLWMQP